MGDENPWLAGERGPLARNLRLDREDVEADVYLVDHSLLVAVVLDEIAVEEAEGLLRRGGGEADEESVEVVEHLTPEVVDRTVALVDDDEVEGFNRDRGVVDDRHRLGVEAGVGLKEGALLALFVELLAGEHCVESLDRGDADFGTRADRLPLEVLDLVFLGELVAGGRARELLKLVERLLAEVVAVDEEENPLSAGVLDEPVAEVDGSEGLPGAGRHLDQGPWLILGQALFEIRDALHLHAPQPPLLERWHCAKPGAELIVGRGQTDELLGAVKAKHLAAAAIGIEGAREAGDVAGRLVGEGKWQPPVGQLLGEPVSVFPRLGLHSGQGKALRLCFDDADRLAASVEEIVGEAGFQGELADGDP